MFCFLGGMIYPILTRELLPKIGFAWTTRVLGFLNLGLLAIAFAFMRPRYHCFRNLSQNLDTNSFQTSTSSDWAYHRLESFH